MLGRGRQRVAGLCLPRAFYKTNVTVIDPFLAIERHSLPREALARLVLATQVARHQSAAHPVVRRCSWKVAAALPVHNAHVLCVCVEGGCGVGVCAASQGAEVPRCPPRCAGSYGYGYSYGHGYGYGYCWGVVQRWAGAQPGCDCPTGNLGQHTHTNTPTTARVLIQRTPHNLAATHCARAAEGSWHMGGERQHSDGDSKASHRKGTESVLGSRRDGGSETREGRGGQSVCLAHAPWEWVAAHGREHARRHGLADQVVRLRVVAPVVPLAPRTR